MTPAIRKAAADAKLTPIVWALTDDTTGAYVEVRKAGDAWVANPFLDDVAQEAFTTQAAATEAARAMLSEKIAIVEARQRIESAEANLKRRRT